MSKSGTTFFSKKTKIDTIQNNVGQLSLIAYPNPAKDNLQIKFSLDSSSNISVLLTNIQGEAFKKIVDNKYYLSGSNTITTDLSDMPSGTYFVQLKTAYGSLVKEISLVH